LPPVYALALGSLAAALLGWPWGLCAGPLAILFGRGRWAFLTGLGMVLASLLLHPNPYADRYGQTVRLAGPYRSGFLYPKAGPIYPELFPRPADGWLRLAGQIARPKRPRNPGGFDQASWLLGQGVAAVLADARILERRPLPPNLRQRAARRLANGLPPEVAGLAEAMVLGERSRLGGLATAFRRAGLAHLLALSGLHVGVLLGFMLLTLYPLGRLRYPLALAALAGYLALAGPSPSLVRAGLMAAAGLTLLFLGRGRLSAAPALALAVSLQLVIAPFTLASLSFRLSYLAVLGLVVLLPPLAKALAGRPAAVRIPGLAMAVTAAAQAPLVPVLLDHFHVLPLLAPLANLLAYPLVAIFLPLAFLKLAGIGWLAAPITLLGHALIALARAFAQGPALSWGSLGAAGYGLYFSALTAVALALWGYLDRVRAALLVALAILIALLPRIFPVLEVWQLDVGEGHATLIRAPGGIEVLVDAGPAWAGPSVVAALLALGVDDLDLLVLTHPDHDHTGGTQAVIDTLPVGAILVSRLHPENDAPLRHARLLGVKVLRVGYGDRLRLGPLAIGVWNPPPRVPPNEDNAKSLVLRFGWRGRHVLVLGDLPRRLEDRLPDLSSEVLVASHHGASNGTGRAVLVKSRPVAVLIGVGNNPFGHPAPSTLERIAGSGALFYRTDRLGAVRVWLAP